MLQLRRARSVLHPVPAGAPRSTRTSAAPRALRIPRRQSSRERCGAARMRPTRLQRRCRREKLGARGEERPFPQRHHDGGHQVQWSTIPQRVARQAYKNFREQMPRASSGARREFSTLYPLFQLFLAPQPSWRGFRLPVFANHKQHAHIWGSLAPGRSCGLQNHGTTCPPVQRQIIHL